MTFFESENSSKPKAILQKEVNEEWFFYRPILERGLSYAEADQLSRYQLDKVNVAYDIKIELENKAIKKK